MGLNPYFLYHWLWWCSGKDSTCWFGAFGSRVSHFSGDASIVTSIAQALGLEAWEMTKDAIVATKATGPNVVASGWCDCPNTDDSRRLCHSRPQQSK
jgi:hypothetical protein